MPSPFDEFLSWLSPDGEEAAVKYEALQKKLIKFFIRGGCHIPDELADVSLDRAGKNVSEGKVDRAVDPNAYCFGIARNVLHEYYKRPRPEPLDLDMPAFKRQPRWSERQWRCFEKCWARMSPRSQDLLSRWHQPEKGSEKIAEHKKMAETEGGINALRIRIHRSMKALRACVAACLKQSSEDLIQ